MWQKEQSARGGGRPSVEEKGETERAPDRRELVLVGAKEKRGGLKTAVLGQAQFFVLSEVDFGRGRTARHHRPPTEKDLAFLASRRPESVSVPPPSRTRERGRGKSFFLDRTVRAVIVVVVVLLRLRLRDTATRDTGTTRIVLLHTDRQHSSHTRLRGEKSTNFPLFRPTTADPPPPSHFPDMPASSGRRVATRDSRAGEEDWTKRKKQNKTSKAEEAEEHKSKRRAKARRVEAELRRK
ncbi:hypothetical protein ANTQUA_LOCUS9385 [Anthophora quadrimaculata]